MIHSIYIISIFFIVFLNVRYIYIYISYLNFASHISRFQCPIQPMKTVFNSSYINRVLCQNVSNAHVYVYLMNELILRNSHIVIRKHFIFILISSSRILYKVFWLYFSPSLISTQIHTFLFLSLKILLLFIKANTCCPNIIKCVVFSWTIVDL